MSVLFKGMNQAEENSFLLLKYTVKKWLNYYRTFYHILFIKWVNFLWVEINCHVNVGRILCPIVIWLLLTVHFKQEKYSDCLNSGLVFKWSISAGTGHPTTRPLKNGHICPVFKLAPSPDNFTYKQGIQSTSDVRTVPVIEWPIWPVTGLQ
jgi:hypothetical protein